MSYCMACTFSGFECIRFSFVETFKIYCIRNIDWKCWNATKWNRARLPTNSINTRNDRESKINDKTRAGLSSNAKWPFRASFVKVINNKNGKIIICHKRRQIEHIFIILWPFFIIFRRTISSRSGINPYRLRNILYIIFLLTDIKKIIKKKRNE